MSIKPHHDTPSFEEIKGQLKSVDDQGNRVIIPSTYLRQLKLEDISDGVSFEIGKIQGDGTIELSWQGSLKRHGSLLVAVAEIIETRKYWYSPLGLEQYMELVKGSVASRQREKKDVQLVDYEDDSNYIFIYIIIQTKTPDPQTALETAQHVLDEILAVAQHAADETGARCEELSARLNGWGEDDLDKLVEKVESAETSDEKGRRLEELVSRLFSEIPGLSTTSRLRTATEEIDIAIINDCAEPRFRREAAYIIVECKNWSDKCGKNEFVIFQEKIKNRNRRCTLGFLVSWNGFTSTIEKEMLRGSREEQLIVPITGANIRAAVLSKNFLAELLKSWDKAVML